MAAACSAARACSWATQTSLRVRIIEASYWNTNNETRAWLRRFFDKIHAMPNRLQTGAYSATLHYLRAVPAAGTDETGAVMKKMRKMPVNDVF